MDDHEIHLLKILARKLAEKCPKHKDLPKPKPWKDLSGPEWTQRCLEEDWEKDRPQIAWWNENDYIER